MCSGLPCPICVEADAYRHDGPTRIAEACLGLHEKIHADAHLAAVGLTKEADEPAEEYIDYYMFFYRMKYTRKYYALYKKYREEYQEFLLKNPYEVNQLCSYHEESIRYYYEMNNK
jgi:hypothetical protein